MRYEFTDEEKENSWVIDVGRPSFYEDSHCEWWQKFFNYVETTDIKIMVNAKYDEMREYAFNDGRYGGGGFAFCFWFLTKEDRKTFITYINSELKAGYQHDQRNLTFIRDTDKNLYIRFSEKYLEQAHSFNEESFTNKLQIGPHTYKNFDGTLSIMPESYHATGDVANIILLKKALDEYSLEIK